MNPPTIKLIECPRDAMQGWKNFIPTDKKIRYLNALLRVGFHTLDFGSFVSSKAIPQMEDTREVVRKLELGNSTTKLLAIVANLRGAIDACMYDEISYLGYPFSVSESFQLRNTNATISESMKRVEEIQTLCKKVGKKLVIYISMGFGNPYGDAFSEELVFNWVEKLIELDIEIISLADTVGLASPEQVYDMTSYLIESLPDTEIGVHLHSRPDNWKDKLEAALQAGCCRLDSALKGIGGCPMAEDVLVGNMNTEWMIAYLENKGLVTGIDKQALAECIILAEEIFV
jgi:hydroxymethylglutaryl-CoA lyase